MPKVDTYFRPWFAGALRQLREERGWSVDDLAQAVAAHTGGRGRVSGEYVRKLERGDRNPSMQALSALLGTLGLTLEDLEQQFEPQPAGAFAAGAAPAAMQAAALPPATTAPTWSAEVQPPPAEARARRLSGLRPSRALPRATRGDQAPPYAAPPSPAPPPPAPPPAPAALAAAGAPSAPTPADAAHQAADLMAAFARLTPSQRAALVAHAVRMAAGE